MKTLAFKWTVSRGRDTYGYNICSLWVDGRKVESCNGGGYDMQGTCLADYLMSEYKNRIIKLKAQYGSLDKGKGFYGLTYWKNGKAKRAYHKGVSVSLDGACGFSSIERIAKRIGLDLRYVHSSKNKTIYTLEDSRTRSPSSYR